jgi:serine/threonine-protein kinase HipA
VEREVDVFIDHAGTTTRVGRLWSHVRGDRESASFAYDAAWLAQRGAFALDPELPLSSGRVHTTRALFNAFTDPAPDRWGQNLLRRAERRRAQANKRRPRTLFAFDFLVGIDDATRLGALRFQDPATGAFLAAAAPKIPPVVALGRLLAATTRVLADRETDADLELLLAPGTSLGGARPKATVLDQDGALLVAKFPRQDDDWLVPAWEATALALAELAGITVPPWRLQHIAKRPVLLVRRFDRRGAIRIPFMSGMTAVAAHERDGAEHSYLELVAALRREGAEVAMDLEQLWRRVVFNVLVSNTDDHLRNHGFLRDARGWRLAPAYDLNPVPADVRPRIHALALDERDATSSLELALATAAAYGIGARKARTIGGQVGAAVARWREVAKRRGINARGLDRMASAFEHDELAAARRGARAGP